MGKDWCSFISEPIVKRFLRAGNIVLDEKIWNALPEASRGVVEEAADGLGLSIDELRRRVRFAARIPHGPCGSIVEEGETRGITNGNEKTATVNVTGKYYLNMSNGTNAGRDTMEIGPSILMEDKNEEGEMSKLWKAMGNMQLQLKEERSKRETLEQKIVEMEVRNLKQEETIEEMKIEMIEIRSEEDGDK